MHIKNECSDLCFRHLIGSALINNASPGSDVDWFNVHKLILVLDPFFNAYDNRYSIVSYTDFVNDSISIDLTELISIFTQVKETQAIVYFSKILSHLYAIKYELVTDIRDTEAFEFYLDWLKSPGVASVFWNKVKDLFWRYLESIPDSECNWSQDFDGSDKHIESKKTWENLQVLSFPTVDKNLGYDNLHAKRVFQDMFIIKSILLPNSAITDAERNFLKRMRSGEVPFSEYKIAKIYIWKKTRLALESWHHLYFLGYGYSLEESLQKKVFGTKGLLNLIDMYTVFPSELN